jgi:site-specific DNA-cytosine methylase
MVCFVSVVAAKVFGLLSDPRNAEEIQEAYLASGMQSRQIVMNPIEWGFPQTRKRPYWVALNRDRLLS